MNIKESLDKLKTLLGADASDALAIVADIERQNSDRDRAMNAANKESEKRRLELEEKDSVIAQKEAEIAKAQSPELKAEIAEGMKAKAELQAIREKADADTLKAWESKAQTLKVDKTSKLHDKVQKVIGQFTLPTEGQELTIDQIKENLKTYTLLESTGYFTTETTDAGGKAPIGKTTDNAEFATSGAAIANMLKSKQ